MTELTWINHSGFQIAHQGTRLACDPWLSGRILNDAWDLLVPTVYTPDAFGAVDCIWFSHEHPDHFSPPSLKKIDPAHRPRIKVIYQPTRDKRVIDFCRKQGFDARELELDAWHELGPEFHVKLGKMPFYDSFMALKLGDLHILNLNDCVIRYEHQLPKIRDYLGWDRVDVLLQQFRSANWTGNPDESERMHRAAREKLDRFVMATRFFQPKFTLPMASFTWFCNQDNRCQNLGILPIRDLISEMRDRVDARVILLKPGDTWDMKSDLNIEGAIDFYDAAEKKLDSAEYSAGKRVELTEIFELAAKCRDRARANNSKFMMFLNELFMAPPLGGVKFHLEDLGIDLKFSMTRGLREEKGGAPADMTLNSDCLAWLFRFDFGFDTLFASGRFKLQARNPKKLFRTFSAPILNNMGKSLSGRLLFDKAILLRSVEMLRFLGRKSKPSRPARGNPAHAPAGRP